MTAEEIRLRCLANQYLTNPGPKLQVARDLCGVQAQFMKNAVHALAIRSADFEAAPFEAGLAKNWTLCGTMHVFAREDTPLLLAGRGSWRSDDWSGKTFWNQRACWALSPERQKQLSHIILAALSAGAKTRDELKAVCRAQGDMTPDEENSLFDP